MLRILVSSTEGLVGGKQDVPMEDDGCDYLTTQKLCFSKLLISCMYIIPTRLRTGGTAELGIFNEQI
jgi:hypothetical protein